MNDCDNNNNSDRKDFFNVDTAKLKVLYKCSQTVVFLCVCWIIFLFILTAVMLYLFLMPPDFNQSDFLFMLLFYLLPLYLLFVPAIVGGMKRSGWGRSWSMGVCLLMCTGFPIGTILGFMGIKAFQKKELFSKQKIQHSDLRKEFLYRKQYNIM